MRNWLKFMLPNIHCENICNKSELRRLSAEELMLLNCGVREDLRVPWTTRRSNQSILKEINPEYALEGLMLKLKLQCFGHLMCGVNSLEKTLKLGKIEGRRTKDEMVGWHHQFNGHEFVQASLVGDGQGGLACCSLWGRKESDTTERLNNSNRSIS